MGKIDQLNRQQRYSPEDIFDNSLKKYRIEAGLSVKDLARRVGCSANWLTRMECGQSSPLASSCGLKYCRRIVDVLGVSLVDIFHRDICDIVPRLDPIVISMEDVHGEASSFNTEAEVDRRRIFEFISGCLNERQVKALLCVFWHEMDLKECGETLGSVEFKGEPVGRKRASQIVIHAIRVLREKEIFRGNYVAWLEVMDELGQGSALWQNKGVNNGGKYEQGDTGREAGAGPQVGLRFVRGGSGEFQPGHG